MAASGKGPSTATGEDTLVQLRLGHLNMVQGIIGRLSGFSATAKNFSVTLAAAAVGVNISQDTKGLLWIALAAVALLLIVDAYYLAHERAFRDLYDEIAQRPLEEAKDLGITRPPLKVLRALGSFSVWFFYLPQLVVVLLLLMYK